MIKEYYKDRYKGFNSLHSELEEKSYYLKNQGYDYKYHIMERSISKYVYNSPIVKTFMPFLNSIMYMLINRVKYIRTYNNFFVKRDTKYIN